MSKNIEQKQTDITTFEPNSKMYEYLDTAIELLSDSPSKVTSNCSVGRTTWYDWLKLPGFEDWFYEQYRLRRRRIIPKLDEIGMKHAKRGSFQHWEAMNKKVGELTDAPDGMVNVQVVFPENTLGKYKPDRTPTDDME
jgi:hypothetical protein